MNVKKTILAAAVFSLAASVLLFAGQNASEPANSAVGKVHILINTDESARVEFEAYEAKNNQPARGFLLCSQKNQNRETHSEVVYVKVDGDYAWFAGKCTRDSGNLKGRWFFIAVHDGGTPGKLVDHIWWDWLPQTPDAESIAKKKVENLERPANNKHISAGDVVVRFYAEES